jgi:hypothetical protein
MPQLVGVSVSVTLHQRLAKPVQAFGVGEFQDQVVWRSGHQDLLVK